MSKETISTKSIVDEPSTIGEGTQIWNFVHIRENAEIGKDCVIADYVYVGMGVKVGNGVKLENRVTVFEGVTIEDEVFVGPHVTFTNDFIPRSFNVDWKITPTVVKKGASIGAGAVIICGKTIGEYALIGAGSVVTENIPANALAYGNPARIRGFVCKCGKKLESKKKEKDYILMKCKVCRELFKVSMDDYRRIKKEG